MNKNQRGKYLAKNTIIFTLGNLGTKLIQFFLVPLYTNVLSTADYGVVDLVATIGMVLAPILLLNINDGVMRFALDKGADFNKIMSIGLIAFIFCLIVGLIIFPIGNINDKLSNYSTYIYFYTIAYAGNLLFFGYLRGTEKLLLFSIGNILNATLIAVFNIFFLVVLKIGIAGYFLSYTLSNFICCIYAFIVGNVKEVILNFKIDKLLLIKMIKYSIVLIPNTFMWWIINSSDRVMITSFIGNSANGIYAISCKIPTLLSTIVTIFNTAWSYSAIKENESNDRDEYNNSVYNGLVMLSVVIGAAMMIIMKPFLAVYVSKMYYKAWRFTPYLVVGCVFLSIASFLGSYYTVNKDSKGFLCSSSVAAVVNLALNYVLIPKIGVTGAALATCVSYIAVFFYRAIDTKKYISIKVFPKLHIASYILLIAMGASMFIEGIISYIVMTIVYVGILFVYRETWWMYIVAIKKMIKNR